MIFDNTIEAGLTNLFTCTGVLQKPHDAVSAMGADRKVPQHAALLLRQTFLVARRCAEPRWPVPPGRVENTYPSSMELDADARVFTHQFRCTAAF